MYRVKKLDRSHNDEILNILSNSPIETRFLNIHFDKSPDIFQTTNLWSEDYTYYGIFVKDRLAGFGMHLKYLGYINTEIKPISYFGNFCIARRFRKQGLFVRLAEYMLNELHKDTEYSYCLILKGNKSAEKYFSNSKGLLPSMPDYKKIQAYETRNILIAKRRKENKNFIIRRGEWKDIDIIISLLKNEYNTRLLSPAINKETFLDKLTNNQGPKITDYFVIFDNERLIGVCAAWDLYTFKRTRILKYGRSFLLFRIFYQFIAKILNYPDLPKRGGNIKEVFITDVAIKDRDPEVFKNLLIKIYNEYREKKYNLMIFGSYQGDRLLDGLSTFLTKSLHSNIYLSAKNRHLLEDGSIDCTTPYINIALI